MGASMRPTVQPRFEGWIWDKLVGAVTGTADAAGKAASAAGGLAKDTFDYTTGAAISFAGLVSETLSPRQIAAQLDALLKTATPRFEITPAQLLEITKMKYLVDLVVGIQRTIQQNIPNAESLSPAELTKQLTVVLPAEIERWAKGIGKPVAKQLMTYPQATEFVVDKAISLLPGGAVISFVATPTIMSVLKNLAEDKPLEGQPPKQ